MMKPWSRRGGVAQAPAGAVGGGDAWVAKPWSRRGGVAQAPAGAAGEGDAWVAKPWSRRRNQSNRAQATVEFALVMPVLLILALGLVEVGVVVRAQVLAEQASRAGARAAAVDPRLGVATDAARNATPLDPSHEKVTMSTSATNPTLVSVTVSYVVPTEVPIVRLLRSNVTVSATSTMAVERANGP